MKKHFSKATPISVILNLILIINVIIVVYPVLFTISSSLTKSNSLAATSVIPFTEQTDKSTVEMCEACEGKGYRYIDIKSSYEENGKKKTYIGQKLVDCDVCHGEGEVAVLHTSFKIKNLPFISSDACLQVLNRL
ncbi:MAG: hypothetical protein L6V86_07130 [Treponema sp.]|nr:MAG: hypothetical protein L6V86_07130 [Treponema sp.]